MGAWTALGQKSGTHKLKKRRLANFRTSCPWKNAFRLRGVWCRNSANGQHFAKTDLGTLSQDPVRLVCASVNSLERKHCMHNACNACTMHATHAQCMHNACKSMLACKAHAKTDKLSFGACTSFSKFACGEAGVPGRSSVFGKALITSQLSHSARSAVSADLFAWPGRGHTHKQTRFSKFVTFPDKFAVPVARVARWCTAVQALEFPFMASSVLATCRTIAAE